MANRIAEDRVTCQNCVDRLKECPTNEHGFPLAENVYWVGNIARPMMGHSIWFSEEGRVSLCAADRR